MDLNLLEPNNLSDTISQTQSSFEWRNDSYSVYKKENKNDLNFTNQEYKKQLDRLAPVEKLAFYYDQYMEKLDEDRLDGDSLKRNFDNYINTVKNHFMFDPKIVDQKRFDPNYGRMKQFNSELNYEIDVANHSMEMLKQLKLLKYL